MNNFKVRAIIKNSFEKSIQNKWFIIFNLVTLVSIILMFNWGNVSNLFKSEDENDISIAILDLNNLIYDELYNELSKKYEVERIYINDYTAENISDNLVIVEVKEDEAELFTVSVILKEGIQGQKYNEIKEALHTARNKLFEEKYTVSSEMLANFQSDVRIERIMLAVDANDSDTKEIIKLFSSAVTYLIAILIFSKIANEISQEKQSKSSEYILTAVSEKEYLFAKIFGNVIVLVFQGLLLLVYYYIAIIISNLANVGNLELGSISNTLQTSIDMDIVNYILMLIVYNVLNIVLMCIIQATLSAKTTSSSEAGNTVSFLSFTMVVAYIATVEFITPYTEIGVFLSIFSCMPIISAYFIPALMVIGQIELWQIVLSLALIIIAIPASFNICSKIFKNGILDYTKVSKKKAKNIEESKNNFITKRKIKNVGFVIGSSIIIYFGLQTIFSLIGAVVLPTIFKGILIEEDISMILQIILQVTSLGLASVFVFAYSEKAEKKETKKIKLKSKIEIIFISIFLVFALQFVLSGIIYPAIGLDYNITDTFATDSTSSELSKVILILTLSVTPAIFEELFFRKAIIDFLSPHGKKMALLISALLFGMIHMNLSQGLFAFIIGLIFGGIYLYTNDIKVTMFIHFINNGIGALGMILPESGAIIVVIALLLICLIGLILLIKFMLKKETREKAKQIISVNITKTELLNYKYVFTDFVFDISLALVILMSILTENILR